MYKIEFSPYPKNANISEIVVSLLLTETELNIFNKMDNNERYCYFKNHATITVTEFSASFDCPTLFDLEISKIDDIKTIDYKAKYERCIEVINRFDAGIIGMYNL